MLKKNQQRVILIILVLLIFFLISFATNVLNAIIAEVRSTYDLSLTATGLLPFSFFVAYGVMSVPAGYLADKFPPKHIVVAALVAIAIAATGFVVFPDYGPFLVVLFAMGCSMAVLQVVINPLLRLAAGSEHFAFYSLIAQLVFGGASFLSPLMYKKMVDPESKDLWEVLRDLVAPAEGWVGMYVLFAVMALILAGITAGTPFLQENQKNGQDDKGGFKALLRSRATYFYFFGIFFYVGIEQGIGNWISPFLQEYHNLDPQVLGALTVSRFWGMLTLGCVLGLFMVKVMDSKRVLAAFTFMAIVCLFAALLGNASLALIAFPACGFFISVMWSVIFSLALNSVKEYHGTFSGILCTGIAGGAFVPFIVGALGSLISLRYAMFFLLLPLAYVLYIAFKAKPLVRNKTF
ncbi:MFS transporter [Robertkochia sediminum]|uniref:MFS transporter n=1 Tax=Robertkochia sediminum TaxID=2785326 RepID=UPI0019315153|nr:MFS transporter [Robertkochia sediminum]MBL7473796.1 MFS transporter [Robertkochia sediminum]